MGFTPVSSRSGHVDMGWIVSPTNELQEGQRLTIVRRILGGERKEGTIPFAGEEFPLYTLGDVQLVLPSDFLTY